MATPQALLASARSAYRSALRASASTFSGDPVVRKAFLLKVRTDLLPYDPSLEPKQFEEKITHLREVADVLRKNVVQIRKVEETAKPDEDRWELNMTEDTELGSNDTIKQARSQLSRSARKRDGQTNSDQTSLADGGVLSASVPRYYSQLKKAHKERIVPELREEDLEESFVRGSGPGGQSVNKTENNVQLLHKPTGLRVACQETRSLKQNRKLARRILLDKLDALYNPGLSKQEMQKAKQIERERRRRKKAKKKSKSEQETLPSEADQGEEE